MVRIEVDYAKGEGALWRSDGKVATIEIEPFASAITKLMLDRDDSSLGLTTSRGDSFVVELPTLDDAAPLQGRPVVYLDQNAWSTVATARHNPHKLPEAERDAALWVADLARSRQVVLPFSAGNLTETTHWSDNYRRYQLGLTIAELSRGWQMLDPLELRSAEMRRTLAQPSDPATNHLPQAWTLDPNASWSGRDLANAVNLNGFPPEASLMVRAATAISGLFDAVLDDKPLARSDPHGWEERWVGLAKHVRETKKPKHLTQLAVHAAFVDDARKEFAQAACDIGISPADFSDWFVNRSQAALRELPALGLAREVMTLKILNNTATWTTNDLTDILYLVQAAGYADAVVGEKSFVSLTQQAQRRLVRPVNAHISFAALRQSGILSRLLE